MSTAVKHARGVKRSAPEGALPEIAAIRAGQFSPSALNEVIISTSNWEVQKAALEKRGTGVPQYVLSHLAEQCAKRGDVEAYEFVKTFAPKKWRGENDGAAVHRAICSKKWATVEDIERLWMRWYGANRRDDESLKSLVVLFAGRENTSDASRTLAKHGSLYTMLVLDIPLPPWTPFESLTLAALNMKGGKIGGRDPLSILARQDLLAFPEDLIASDRLEDAKKVLAAGQLPVEVFYSSFESALRQDKVGFVEIFAEKFPSPCLAQKL